MPLTENVEEAKGYELGAHTWPGLDQFIENTKNAKTRPTVTTYPEISTAMGKAIGEVLYKRADAQQALEGAVSAANKELELAG